MSAGAPLVRAPAGERLDEAAGFGVVVSRVEIHQAHLVIVPLADEAQEAQKRLGADREPDMCSKWLVDLA